MVCHGSTLRGLSPCNTTLSLRGRNPKNVQNLGQNRQRGHSLAHNQERFKSYEDMGWTGGTQLRAMDEEDNP